MRYPLTPSIEYVTQDNPDHEYVQQLFNCETDDVFNIRASLTKTTDNVWVHTNDYFPIHIEDNVVTIANSKFELVPYKNTRYADDDRFYASVNTGYNPVVELTINDVEFLIYLKTPVSSVDMKASIYIDGEAIYLLVNGEKVAIPSPLTQNQSPCPPFQPSPTFSWVGPPHQQHNPPQAEYVNPMFRRDF